MPEAISQLMTAKKKRPCIPPPLLCSSLVLPYLCGFTFSEAICLVLTRYLSVPVQLTDPATNNPAKKLRHFCQMRLITSQKAPASTRVAQYGVVGAYYEHMCDLIQQLS